jgi:hypothetical protein
MFSGFLLVPSLTSDAKAIARSPFVRLAELAVSFTSEVMESLG